MAGLNELVGSYAGTFKIIAIVMVISFLFMFLIALFFYASLHKQVVRVYYQDGSKILRVKRYKCRLKKNKGVTEIKPLNPRDKWITNEIKPPDEPMTWYYEGNKQVLNLYKNSNGDYSYIRFTKPKGQEAQLKIISEDMRDWLISQYSKADDKHKILSFFEKYGQIISIATIGVIWLAGLIIIGN